MIIEKLKNRWPALAALASWIGASWRRPAGEASRWEQVAGRQEFAWEASTGKTQDQSKELTGYPGAGPQNGPDRHQAIQEQGTGT
jgi:hypothetical protein